MLLWSEWRRDYSALYLLNAFAVVTGTLIALLPVLFIATGTMLDYVHYFGGQPLVDDRYIPHVGIDDASLALVYAAFPREALMATTTLAIPSSLDTLMDLLLWLNWGQRSTGNVLEAAKTTKAVVVRLNLFERMLFCFGALICGITTMCPLTTHYNLIVALNSWSYNCATFLTSVPILLFLSRVTQHWNGGIWTVLNLSLILVGVVGSFEPLVSNMGSPLYLHMITCAFVLMLLSIALYVYHMIRMLVAWLPSLLRVHDESRQRRQSIPLQLWDSVAYCYKQLNINYAVSLHTFSLGVALADNVWYYAVYFYQGSFSNYGYGVFGYVFLMALALVFTVEMRVRHKEVCRSPHLGPYVDPCLCPV